AAYFILCIHWFNPLVWAAFLLMGVDMEMSCDEHVLQEKDGATKKDYSLSLLSLATERRIICGSPLAFGEGGVKARIKNVLTFRKPSRLIIIAAAALVAVLSIGFSLNGVSEAINTSVVAGDMVHIGGYDWVVLEVKEGKALVLSDKILSKRAYHSSNIPITWEKCDLRRYLNGQFYDFTFSAAEKRRIIATMAPNNDNPLYDTPGGNDTIDKVFLLSLEEIARYFGDSGEQGNRPQADSFLISDAFNAGRIAQTQDGKPSWWWTRSPGAAFIMCENYFYAAVTAADGALGVMGDDMSNGYGGVRPALWLKL
ncbi:MAG: DUF6273 domain-containing protein, partial [Clostridiales bacterium]|nr:DUF6273 domain-containing protein [Clostridiales bacterium]